MNTTIESSFLRTHGRRAVGLAALVALVASVTLIVAGERPARAEPQLRAQAQVATQPVAQARPYWKPPRLAATDTRPVQVAEAPAAQAGGLRGVLNLNTADEKQLRMLPGVGATKARRVLAHRKERGTFERVVDLRKVKGFGKKTVEKLAPYLTVDGPTTLERVK